MMIPTTPRERKTVETLTQISRQMQIHKMIEFVKKTNGRDAPDDVFLPASVICALIEAVEKLQNK